MEAPPIVLTEKSQREALFVRVSRRQPFLRDLLQLGQQRGDIFLGHRFEGAARMFRLVQGLPQVAMAASFDAENRSRKARLSPSFNSDRPRSRYRGKLATATW